MRSVASRLTSSLFVLAVLVSGCSGSDATEDAGGADAGSGLDVIPHDSGLFPVPCGALSCTETQYCLASPAGPCAPTDGGACATTEVACQQNGVTGCTPPRTYSCEPMPTACLTLSPCPCLTANDLCPNMGRPTCLVSERQGPTIECPFP